MHGTIIGVLAIATISMAIADESILTQSFSNSEFDEIEKFTPNGHVEDFSWIKRVSVDGVIEISGIEFSVVNDDEDIHSFEVCTIIQGPVGIFTPSLDNQLACITTKELEGYEKITKQFIYLPSGVKVSNLVNISIAVQES